MPPLPLMMLLMVSVLPAVLTSICMWPELTTIGVLSVSPVPL
jgi:hypothetical protein